MALDTLVVLAAVLAAAWLRQHASVFGTSLGYEIWALPASVAVWVATIALAGGYSKRIFDAGTEEFRRVAVGSVAAAGALSAICYFIEFRLSRGLFLGTFIIGVPLLFSVRWAARAAVQHAREAGALHHSVLIVGTVRSVDDVAQVLRRERRLGYRVAGALVTDPSPGSETSCGVPVLGAVSNIGDQVRSMGVDIVFLADGSISSTDGMRELAWDLEHDDVQVVVAPNISGVSNDRIRVRPIGGLPLIHIDPPRTTDASRWGKRAFDVAASTLLILMTLPIFLYAATRIRVHDGGPIFFRQVRVGRNGHEFNCLKFRTMVVDAEQRLEALQSQVGFESGLFKLARDPRVTAPGAMLRRLSIDELPQLLNVARGEMSLIGPRPGLPSEVAAYPEIAHRRLRVRPGLTGLWQVSGRSELSFEEAIRLDLYYVDNWSMLQDLHILTRTAGAVIRSRGAY